MDIGQVIETDDYLTAEIGKEAHNAFFATKVSFANQMRLIAEAGGADPERVMDIVTADSRNTTSHLDPTLGPYGGKCLPKDTEALAMYGGHKGVRVPLLHGTMQTNELARQRFENAEIAGNWPEIKTTSSD
jgi:UDPglucose 6-dehydrogenase